MQSGKLFALKMWKYLKDCRKILDAGCGSGSFGKVINELIPEAKIVGVDITIHDGLVKPDHFLRMSVEHLGFQDSSFCCVIAKDVIEHLIFPLDAMKEFHRVLKPGGKLIVTVPSNKAPFLWDDYTHVRPFTEKSLRKLFVDAEFKVLHIGYLATSTPGASFLKIHYLLDLLARLGVRRGNIWAAGQKLARDLK